MNPFSGVTWLWRAWRGHSVTFAALFALGILGVSVLGSFRHLLSHWGAPWYVWLLVPFIVVSILARKESEWVPDANRRRQWSRWLLLGSVILVLLMAKFGPKRAPEPVAEEPADAAQPARP